MSLPRQVKVALRRLSLLYILRKDTMQHMSRIPTLFQRLKCVVLYAQAQVQSQLLMRSKTSESNHHTDQKKKKMNKVMLIS